MIYSDHQNNRVELGISMNHYADVYGVLDPLDQWCAHNGFPFSSRPTDVDLDKGLISVLYIFEDAEHALQFALTFYSDPVIITMDLH